MTCQERKHKAKTKKLNQLKSAKFNEEFHFIKAALQLDMHINLCI